MFFYSPLPFPQVWWYKEYIFFVWGDFMSVNQIILYILTFGAALGGIDLMLGNRFGYGEKFESGFQLLGPVALSMAGIICLAPVLSAVLGHIVQPVCDLLHLDPGIFGSILAIDMGGYQLSVDLARDTLFGQFSGIILSSIFGCTVVFSIPVGLGFLTEEDRPYFTKGILIGLATMPVSILTAAFLVKMPLSYAIWNSLPILLLSVLMGFGVLKKPEAMMSAFLIFAKSVKFIAVLGLTLAAISHLSGFTVIANLLSLEEAMATVNSICIVMLGSMPLAELIQRLLKKPFHLLNEKCGLNSASVTGLMLGLVSATPALAMIHQMNRRGQVVISAALVSCICSFGAHFAFANSLCPEMVPALLAAKLLGGLLGGIIAMYATRDLN